MPSLASAVSLLVAISDLKLVRSITRAINANLPKDGPLGTIRPSSAQLYARPRRYYSPTPAWQGGNGASYVAKPANVSDRRADACHCPAACPPRAGVPDHTAVLPEPPVAWPAGVTSYRPAGFWSGQPGGPWTGPGVPPWRVLPPVREDRPVIRLQVVHATADACPGGTRLDLFA